MVTASAQWRWTPVIVAYCLILQSWNAYLGRLPSQRLCIEEQIKNYTPTSTPSSVVASALVDFYVSQEELDDLNKDVTFLVGVLNGTQLKTQIRSNSPSP